ncbi:MAG: hypothetical protein K0Q54_3232, partial [Methylobacterium brachiatum]|nr:hypothetical protein [Methylobacterium brachiatum]
MSEPNAPQRDTDSGTPAGFSRRSLAAQAMGR